MKEVDLAKHFVSYFSDKFEIYQEVDSGTGIIDIVAVNDIITVGVEVKTRFNFEVLEQAYRNLWKVNLSYIAVPVTKKTHFGYKIASDYGVGVITYADFLPDTQKIVEAIEPKLTRTKFNIRTILKEYQKRSVAGSQGAERMTAYKNTIEIITNYLKRHNGTPISGVLKNIEHHWGSNATAKSCLYQYMKRGIIKEFYLENSKLYLTQE